MFRPKNPKKAVLIVGGSFGGLTAIKCLDNNDYDIILVDKKSYFEVSYINFINNQDQIENNQYTPSFPFALIGPDYFDRITFNLEDFAKQNNCQYIQGSLEELLKDKSLIRLSQTEIKTIKFDYCVISTGSSYASQIKADNQILNSEQKKEQILQLVNKLKNSKKILIIGGGFVATEIAEIYKFSYGADKQNFYLNTERRQENLQQKYQSNKEYNLKFDYKFDCRGNIYAPTFMKREFSEYLDEKGRILVDQYCRLKTHQNIFCVGDACITPNDESKMGYNSTIQGQFAADNYIKIECKSKSLKKGKCKYIFNFSEQKRNSKVFWRKCLLSINKREINF
ncbi:hypothetical protein ABPG72_016638 [Tetrahymena utriculariae]